MNIYLFNLNVFKLFLIKNSKTLSLWIISRIYIHIYILTEILNILY